jgi:hypothetical protein
MAVCEGRVKLDRLYPSPVNYSSMEIRSNVGYIVRVARAAIALAASAHQNTVRKSVNGVIGTTSSAQRL